MQTPVLPRHYSDLLVEALNSSARVQVISPEVLMGWIANKRTRGERNLLLIQSSNSAKISKLLAVTRPGGTGLDSGYDKPGNTDTNIATGPWLRIKSAEN